MPIGILKPHDPQPAGDRPAWHAGHAGRFSLRVHLAENLSELTLHRSEGFDRQLVDFLRQPGRRPVHRLIDQIAAKLAVEIVGKLHVQLAGPDADRVAAKDERLPPEALDAVGVVVEEPVRPFGRHHHPEIAVPIVGDGGLARPAAPVSRVFAHGDAVFFDDGAIHLFRRRSLPLWDAPRQIELIATIHMIEGEVTDEADHARCNELLSHGPPCSKVVGCFILAHPTQSH